jgi:endonuclease YncB( thermonuclease family)
MRTFLIVFATGAALMNLPSGAPISATGWASSPLTSLRVIDGDTFEVRDTGERIRLANIDTPEKGDLAHCAAERAAAEIATGAARKLISSAQQVTISREGRLDIYGRTIGYVIIDGRDLGDAMIGAGYARPWRGRREPWCASNGALLR